MIIWNVVGDILTPCIYKSAFFLIQELRRFPTLQSDIAAASNESLEKFREESRKTVLRLVDMESSYLTVEFFRKIHQIEPEKNPNRNGQESFTDMHLRKIGMWSPTNFLITCITYRFISNELRFWITSFFPSVHFCMFIYFIATFSEMCPPYFQWMDYKQHKLLWK